jgi:D-alanyl-D-alanine endopeptidase (penicillin-binding protein 7)
MVALETGYGPDRKLDLVKSPSSHLPRQSYTRRELLTALLVKSDNAAAETLAHDYPGGRTEFLIEMNELARRLGMKNTHFDDASGLSAKNVSTAEDIVIMFQAAMKQDFIRTVSTQTRTELEVQGKKRPIKVVFGNTNTTLLEEFKNTIVSKTGFTNPAGLCVAMALEEQGQQFVVVVMGATTKRQRTQLVESTIYNNLRP